MTPSRLSVLPALVLSALLPLALLSAGCPSSNSCDASNCLGCCQDDGTCAPGNQASACGAGGATCDSCSNGQQCSSAGVCGAACSDACLEGANRCESGKRIACVRGANGCLAYAAPEVCPGTQVCSGGACVDHCSDQCPEGTGRCAGSSVQYCERQSTGCTEWGEVRSCAIGNCQNGKCSNSQCTDACTAGQQRCANTQRQETCQTGSSGCLEWVAQDCGAAEACTGTRCEAVSPCSPPCPEGFTCNSALVCEGGTLTSLILNTDLINVLGHFTVNGAIPSFDAAYCADAWRATYALVSLTFEQVSTGAKFETAVRCNQNGFNYALRLPPGKYNVYAEPYSSNDANVRMSPFKLRVASNVTLTEDTPDLKLNQGVPAVSGKLTVNSAVPTLTTPAGCTSDSQHLADLTFYRSSSTTPAGEDEFATLSIDCGHKADFSFETFLPVGTYDVRISPAFAARPAGPRIASGNLKVPSPVSVTGPTSSLVLNQVVHPVSGRLTVNGATPTLKGGTCTSSLTVAEIIASNNDFSGTTPLPCTSDFSFSLLLPPGSQSVYFRDAGGYGKPVSTLPPMSVKRTLNVTGPLSNQVWDQVVFPVSGKVTVNGAAPVLGAQCFTGDRLLNLMVQSDNALSGTVTLYCEDNFQFATVLPAGKYTVQASPSGSTQLNTPEGFYAFTPFTVSSATSGVVLNEVVYPVSGKVLNNGVAPTGHEPFCQQTYNRQAPLARVSFSNTVQGATNGTKSITCERPAFDFTAWLPAGTYKVETQPGFDTTGSNFVPGRFPNLTVNGTVSNLLLDQTVRTVSGRLTVNDLLPTVDASYCANSSNLSATLATVTFTDETASFKQTAYVRCKDSSFSFTTLLPPGTYDVRVAKANTSAGLNFGDGPAQAVAKLRVP
ncbi:hypothetical protein [Hyalangium versicolor]|uniref:hypothetical protein n=1 Tax=Hyalangium versicolor TaxID=2861190 RepID=UPI001CCBCB84|nr:hypothetical protein [Hyalangium versicolor]